MTAPISGGKYFTHDGLIEIFRRHGLKLARWSDLYVRRQAGTGIGAALVARLPMIRGYLASRFPDRFICHRCYILECIS
jgi:hypothetical protein